ncbi:MAG: response regulator, partial [Bacteroidota bacterium]
MKSLSLFIVEDDPIIAADIRMTVEGLGHQVLAVSHRSDRCLEMLKQVRPDLMLLDIDLGKGNEDGVSLAKVIKSTYGYPYIYLTSYFDDSTIQ